MKAHKSRDLRISDNCLTWRNFSLIVFLLKQHGKRYVWVALRLNFLGMTSASAVDWRFRNHYFNHYRVFERYRYLLLISVSIFRAESGLLTFPVYKRHQSLISVSIWSDRKVESLFTKILFSCCKGSSRIIIILRQNIQIGIWIGAAMEEAIWKGQSTGVKKKKGIAWLIDASSVVWLLSTTASRSDCEISRDCGKIAIYVQATFEVAISIGEISYADASFSLFRKILSILVPS